MPGISGNTLWFFLCRIYLLPLSVPTMKVSLMKPGPSGLTEVAALSVENIDTMSCRSLFPIMMFLLFYVVVVFCRHQNRSSPKKSGRWKSGVGDTTLFHARKCGWAVMSAHL